MYVDIKKENVGRYDCLKLCYIDSIPTTYTDYTPEAKRYRETDEWKQENERRDAKLKKEGVLSYYDPEFGLDNNRILHRGSEIQDYPNPDYIEEKQVYYAYFTPAELDKQWGDDWDDAPYEYNAEIPYDDYYEGEMKVELNIMRLPFYVFHDEWEVKFPRDWGSINSKFSVQDINSGAVAWIYDRKTHTAINAGCSPREFVEKIDKINKAREDDK